MVRGVVLASLLLALVADPSAARAERPPSEVVPIEEIFAVDNSGRYVIGRMPFVNPSVLPVDVRLDRVTGEVMRIPHVVAVGADLTWAITLVDTSGIFEWVNLETGESGPVPMAVPQGFRLAPREMSADGQFLLTGIERGSPAFPGPPEDYGAWVVGRDGTVDQAPVPDVIPGDMSANGRWVLLYRLGSIWRWDRSTGDAALLHSQTWPKRVVYGIGNDGEIIEQEWVVGDELKGGLSRNFVRRRDGTEIEVEPPGPIMRRWWLSDDGAVAVDQSLGELRAIDLRTGVRSSASIPLEVLTLSSNGAVVATLPSVGGSTEKVGIVRVPGRVVPPRVRAGDVIPVPVAGVGGVSGDASAVALNVTVTNPAGPGFATVWPCDEARPEASNVNFSGAGQTVANAVVSKVAVSGGLAGSVCLFSSAGADLIVDVQGYFTGDSYVGLRPDRFLDTREGQADFVGNVPAGERVVLAMAGVGGVPAAASAAVLNVAVTNPAGPGFVTVWPCDEERPEASNVNVTGTGETAANAVVAKLASTGVSAGSVCLFTSVGSDLIVDVQGYFVGDAYVGLRPDRLVDTRHGEPDSVGNLSPGQVVVVPIAGERGVSADAASAVLNVTVTNPAGPGFVTVWPCDEERPEASNVNVTDAGQTVANAVVAKLASSGVSAGSACLFTSVGADVIVDVQGFFTGGDYSGLVPDRLLDTRD